MYLLLNNMYQEIDALNSLGGTSLQIFQSSSDPISTCQFTIYDPGSTLNVLEMQEVVVLDNDALANQAHNLMVWPTLTDTTSYTTYSTGGTIATVSYATNRIQLTASGSAGNTYGSQDVPQTKGTNSPNFFVVVTPGQSYMLSAYATVSTPLVNCQAVIRLEFQDGSNAILATATSAPITAGTLIRLSTSAVCPANATNARVSFGLQSTGGAASGVVRFTSLQLEPMFFTSLGQAYPSPDCNVTQPNCVVLNNGTTVRQTRLFGGFIVYMEFGPYAGPNRLIQVTANSYGWLLDGKRYPALASYTNQFDDFIINDTLNQRLPNVFSTNHVIRGAQFDSVAWNVESYRTIFDALTASTNFRWFVDPYFDIWYVPPGYYSAPYELSDNPDGVTSFAYANYRRKRDFTQVTNVCDVIIGGGTTYVKVLAGQSQAFTYNITLGHKINDNTVATSAAAYLRGMSEVQAFAFARQILTFELDQRAAQANISPGTAINFTNSVEGLLDVSYLIQKVTITYLGTDRYGLTRYRYSVELGAFNPNVVTILTKFMRDSTQNVTTALTVDSQRLVMSETMSFEEAGFSHTP